MEPRPANTPKPTITATAEDLERREHAVQASIRALWRGGLYGTAGGIGITFLAGRLWPAYRALRLPIKTAIVAIFAFGSAAFASEHALYRFSHPQQLAKAVEEARRARQSWAETIFENRLAVVSSIIAAVALGTGYFISQNRNTNATQKFMNVRLYGQIAGILAIAGVMGFTAARQTVPDEHHTREEKR